MKLKHDQIITVLYVAQFVACVCLPLIGIDYSDSEEMFTAYDPTVRLDCTGRLFTPFMYEYKTMFV